MTFVMSIVFSILISYIIYQCFEKYDFKVGAVVQIVITFIQSILENSDTNILRLILTSVIMGFIGACINYFVYKCTDSFISYLLLSIVLTLFLTLALGMFIVSLVGALVGAIA